MGKVLVNFRVRPESSDIDLERVKREITEKIKEVREIKETELAFGMKQLEVLLMFDDQPGGTDQYEEIMSDKEGVQSVETGEITLL